MSKHVNILLKINKHFSGYLLFSLPSAVSSGGTTALPELTCLAAKPGRWDSTEGLWAGHFLTQIAHRKTASEDI